VEKFFDRPDLGKMVIRVILGLIFAWFGVKMLGGGKSALVILDQPFTFLTVTLTPKTWILLTSIVYLIAGILFMAGSFFRTCCTALVFVEFILIKQSVHTDPGEIDLMLLHVVLLAVCLGFLFINPGRYSASN
jgi:putative oxidoreductase